MKKRKSTKKKRAGAFRPRKPLGTKKFDVLVLATMSAGKTSFINALIGQELLHTANEATTACITSVEHAPDSEYFHGICYSHSNHELARHTNISAEIARDWNSNAEVKQIRLSGSFKSVPSPAPGLVLHDTPGPNNSQDERHADLMLEAVRTIPFQALCYVLNASQLGTQDDRIFLNQLRSEMASLDHKTIYFILNKVDLLDAEKGESIEAYVKKSENYLTSAGFKDPVIIPTMAGIALYARKALKEEKLTRSQRLSLQHALEIAQENQSHLIQASTAPLKIKKALLKEIEKIEETQNKKTEDDSIKRKNELKKLITISGIGTIESLIREQRVSS